MSGDLSGRTALVTGGGRGIGAEVARKLASAGAHVVVASRTRDDIDAVAADIGGEALAVDLSDRADCDRFLRDLDGAVGAVDILVNNAGIAASAPLGDVGDEDWDRTLEVNATAAFRLCRALIPKMVAAGFGRVVNVASNAGITGYRYSAAYCASKHAVVGFTRALAVELGEKGVTVNAVCPGWVETRMAEQAIARIAATTGRSEDKARDMLAAMSPQRRLVEPAEVAHAVWSLCSPLARGINGQVVVIDGGQVLK